MDITGKVLVVAHEFDNGWVISTFVKEGKYEEGKEQKGVWVTVKFTKERIVTIAPKLKNNACYDLTIKQGFLSSFDGKVQVVVTDSEMVLHKKKEPSKDDDLPF